MGPFRKGLVVVPGLALGAIALFILVGMGKKPPRPDEGPEKEVVNSIGVRLVLIPAGEFMMGGQEPAEELARAFAAHNRKAEEFRDEYPRHRVRITRPFYLGKYEVTVGQFRQFVEQSGQKSEPERDGQGGWGFNATTKKCEGRNPRYTWRNPGFPQTDEHPVVNVTWNDAVAFCDWLTQKEGVRYRLPTEAEWEYCCRAGTNTRYHNGNDPAALTEVARVADAKGRTVFPHVQDLEVVEEGPSSFTARVGSYPPNAWGLHDMHGNAWEWCSDWHANTYYSVSPVDDPQGSEDEDAVRVRRGGGWNSFPLFARASFRNWNQPRSRCVNLGFRVLREMKDAEKSSP
jgi:formylglycine-generating enzyme required for sulfatase activity